VHDKLSSKNLLVYITLSMASRTNPHTLEIIKVKVKISLLQAMEAHRVARG
jgi:hypothetical protein